MFSSIVAQGETVRQLKTAKASKDQVDKAVQQLLSLKVRQQFTQFISRNTEFAVSFISLLFSMQAQFKQETGLDYKPGMAPPTSIPAPPTTQTGPTACPYTRVTQQGELVRKLKAEQAPKVPGHFSKY